MPEKTLFDKMFIKPGMRVCFLHLPENLQPLYSNLSKDLTVLEVLEPELDVLNIFIADRLQLEAEAPGLRKWLKPSGQIWLCYPKLSSERKTDINRDTIYPYCLSLGYQTTAMISIDETWSAMRMKLI